MPLSNTSSGGTGTGTGGLGGGMTFRPPRPSAGRSFGRKSASSNNSTPTTPSFAHGFQTEHEQENNGGIPPVPALAGGAKDMALPGDDSIGAGDAAFDDAPAPSSGGGGGVRSAAGRYPGLDLTNRPSSAAGQQQQHQRNASTASNASSSAHAHYAQLVTEPLSGGLGGGSGGNRPSTFAQRSGSVSSTRSVSGGSFRRRTSGGVRSSLDFIRAGVSRLRGASGSGSVNGEGVSSSADSKSSSPRGSPALLHVGLPEHGSERASTSTRGTADSSSSSVSFGRNAAALANANANADADAELGLSAASAQLADTLRAQVEAKHQATVELLHLVGELGQELLQDKNWYEARREEMQAEADLVRLQLAKEEEEEEEGRYVEEEDEEERMELDGGRGRRKRAPRRSAYERQNELERLMRLRERFEAEVEDVEQKRQRKYRDLLKATSPTSSHSTGSLGPANTGNSGNSRNSIGGLPASGSLVEHSFATHSSGSEQALSDSASFGGFRPPVNSGPFSFLDSDPAASTNPASDAMPTASTSTGTIVSPSSTRQAERRTRNAEGAGAGKRLSSGFVEQIQGGLVNEVRRLQAENQKLAEKLARERREHQGGMEELLAKHALVENSLKGMARDHGECGSSML